MIPECVGLPDDVGLADCSAWKSSNCRRCHPGERLEFNRTALNFDRNCDKGRKTALHDVTHWPLRQSQDRFLL